MQRCWLLSIHELSHSVLCAYMVTFCTQSITPVPPSSFRFRTNLAQSPVALSYGGPATDMAGRSIFLPAFEKGKLHRQSSRIGAIH